MREEPRISRFLLVFVSQRHLKLWYNLPMTMIELPILADRIPGFEKLELAAI